MAEGSDFLSWLSVLCNNREGNNARHEPMIRKGAEGDETDGTDLTYAATAIHDSLVLKEEELGEFGKHCFGILPNTIYKLKEKHAKGSSSFVPWIRSMIFAWIEIIDYGNKGTSATVGDFEDVLDSNKYVATKERWLAYRDEAMDCCRTYCRELNTFIKNLFNHFKKLNPDLHRDQKWMQFCMALGVDQMEFDIETLFRWVEQVGYLTATKDKLKEALKEIGLRRAIYPIENLYGGEPPLKCKLFSDFMEDNFTKIMEKLTSIQIQGIAEDLGCEDDQDEIFNEIVKQGNQGFHIFASALKHQISDLSNVYDEDVTILFQMTMVPKRHFFVESQGHTLMRDCFKEDRMQGFIGPHMLDMVQYGLEFAERFRDHHALSVIYCLNGTNSESLNSSIQALIEELCKTGLSHPEAGHRSPERAIEVLAEVLKCSDFNVLLICYNCSKDVCEKRVWEKLVPSRKYDTDPPLFKVHILFLTTDVILKEFKWIHWQDWPVFEEEEILKFLIVDRSATEEEKAIVKNVGELCENSLFELGIVKAFWVENMEGITDVLAVLQDHDNTKEHYTNFKSDWIREHMDEFLKTLGFFCEAEEPAQPQSQVDCLHDVFAQLEEHGAAIIELRKENQDQGKLMKESQKNIKNLETKIKNLENENEEIKKEKEILKKDHEELQKQIVKKDGEMERVKKEHDKEMKAKDVEHQKELNAMWMEKEKLRLKLENNEELKKLQKREAEIIEKERKIERSIDDLKTELKEMKARANNCKAVVEDPRIS